MSYEDVEIHFKQVMDIAENEENPPIFMIQDTITEGLFSLGYDPKGRFSDELTQRVISWVEKNWNWEKGDIDFIDGLVAIYINFASNKQCKNFLEYQLKTDSRDFVQDEVRDALENDV